jgi:hypothetical protein
MSATRPPMRQASLAAALAVVLAGGALAAPPGGIPADATIECLPCKPLPGNLWLNGACDGYGAIGSYERSDGALPPILAADDFAIPASCELATLERIHLNMALLPLDDPPTTGRLEVYADDGGRPAPAPLHSLDFVVAPAVEGCIRSGQFLFMVHALTFDTPGLTLTPGRWWLSPVGWNVAGNEYFLFATAGDGVLRLGEAQWHNTSYSPEPWNGTSLFPFFQDSRRDFAFAIEGSCSGLLRDGLEDGDLRAFTPHPLR